MKKQNNIFIVLALITGFTAKAQEEPKPYGKFHEKISKIFGQAAQERDNLAHQENLKCFERVYGDLKKRGDYSKQEYEDYLVKPSTRYKMAQCIAAKTFFHDMSSACAEGVNGQAFENWQKTGTFSDNEYKKDLTACANFKTFNSAFLTFLDFPHNFGHSMKTLDELKKLPRH